MDYPDEIVISETESVCPVCFARIPASVIRASAKNFVPFVVPEFRHSGERRNPVISMPRGAGLDPGFRRGDDQGDQSVPDKIMDNCYSRDQPRKPLDCWAARASLDACGSHRDRRRIQPASTGKNFSAQPRF